MIHNFFDSGNVGILLEKQSLRTARYKRNRFTQLLNYSDAIINYSSRICNASILGDKMAFCCTSEERKKKGMFEVKLFSQD